MQGYIDEVARIEASAIWIHFETITGEQIALPIDFLSRIEFSGQQEI